MSTTAPDLTRARGEDAHGHRNLGVRRSTETTASFKTTEFAAYLVMLAGLRIAGAVTNVLFLPLFFLLPLGGFLGHRRRHRRWW